MITHASSLEKERDLFGIKEKDDKLWSSIVGKLPENHFAFAMTPSLTTPTSADGENCHLISAPSAGGRTNNHCQAVEVPPVAICAGGHFPSTHWCTYSTCAQAICTVWWYIYIIIYYIHTYVCMYVCMHSSSLCKCLAVVNAMPAFSIYYTSAQ